jgi:hypothetical protein
MNGGASTRRGMDHLPTKVVSSLPANPSGIFSMNTYFIIFLACILISGTEILQGQTAVATSPSAAVQAGQLPPPTPYAVTKQDGNSKVWERTVFELDSNGQPVPKKHSYTELGTGMNYQDAQGQWQPSVASFHMVGNFFVADTVPTKVILAPDLNITNAVTTVTADGITLSSTPVAIALYDAASGNSLVIGVVTNCTGALVSSNQVVYANAFSGVSADVYYTVKRGTFDQDVVLTGRLNPEDYGFPTNTTRIQILTEFYQPDKPEKIRHPLYVEKNEAVRNQMVTPDLMDETLDFGQLVFGHGKAYTSATPNGAGTPVAKEYKTISGRTFLIETVRYKSIRKELESLPASNVAAGSTKLQPHNQSGKAYAAIPRPGSGVTATTASKSRSLLALNRRAGVVIDYVTIYGSFGDAAVFKGDTTYIVDYPAYYEGALTIEGGAVIKYMNPVYSSAGPSSGPAWIQIDNSLTCDTSAYRPAIFTATDDNTVGETYTGYGTSSVINTNGYASPALLINNFDSTGDQTIGNLRFRYAATAIELNPVDSETLFTINDSQFVNCIQGMLVLDGFSCGDGGEALNNCLMANVQYPSVVEVGSDVESAISYYIDDNQSWYNCTIVKAAQFYTATFTYDEFYTGGKDPRVGCCNCVFANVTAITDQYTFIGGDHNGFYSSPEFGTSTFTNTSNPFQTVGAGGYYLTNGSPFRNVGTPGISSDLLADLQQKTTYPPLVYSNQTFSVATNFSPQAQRDTDTPDLGYHYDPLDYIVDKCTVTNATLTVSSGTAIASYNEPGIQLQNGSSIISVGTPLSPNWFVRYQLVQEVPVALGGTNVAAGQTVSASGGASAVFQFSKFAAPAFGGSYLLDTITSTYSNLVVQNCEFWGGQNDLTGSTNTTAVWMNNLFYRSPINAAATNLPSTLAFSNNLVFGGTITLKQPTNSVWYAFNNDFDSTTITNSTLTNGYNAYLNCSGYLSPTNGMDIFSTNGLIYQTGPLGDFYQPADSPLINTGSTNANLLGLYHFTTQTNQVPETNSIVDIGYHYVATDTNGIPLDSNGDGVPDYLEDANGNGLVDSGEIGWNIVGDLGLRVIIIRPRNGSVLP